jgi:hypothetical protein
MSKRFSRPVRVESDCRGCPRHFRWGQRQVQVEQVLEEWEEAGCWWRGEAARRVYRVLAAGGMIYELHHQPPTGWLLYRAYD